MEIKKKTRTLLIRIVMLAIYLTSGAAIFSAIEHDGTSSEENFTKKIIQLKNNMTLRFNETMDVIDQYIEELRGLFEAAHRCKYRHNDWSYYQSLYFVGSVTTTIGKKREALNKKDGIFSLSRTWDKENIRVPDGNGTHGLPYSGGGNH